MGLPHPYPCVLCKDRVDGLISEVRIREVRIREVKIREVKIPTLSQRTREGWGNLTGSWRRWEFVRFS
jgi:hypothetical protein